MFDLFSGIGGFSLAARWMGWETVGFCEIDPFCQAVLRHHWPDVPIHPDITDLHGEEFLNERVREFFPPAGDDYTTEEWATVSRLRKLTPEQATEAVRMYESGLSLAPIASYFAVTRQAMWDLLRRRTTMRPQTRYGSENHFHRGTSDDDQAQNLVETAVSQGVLTRPEICEACGKTPPPMKNGRTCIQAHHADYNRPLEVQWLCQKCHHEWHKHNQAVKKVRTGEVPAGTEMLVGGFP